MKAVVNGLINQLVLGEVSSLEEEVNYREENRLHPTLLKMLRLKWKASSRKNALSSIYE